MQGSLQFIRMIGRFTIYTFVLITVLTDTLFAAKGLSQAVKSVKEARMNVTIQDKVLTDALRVIEAHSDYHFVYKDSDIKNNNKIPLSVIAENQTLESILLEIAEKANVSFRQVNDRISVRSTKVSGSANVEIVLQQSVSGKITDENGEPLPGATILERGTTNGTTTDLDGQFQLNCSDDAVLIISFVGYQTQEILVNNRSVIAVQMALDESQLEEVVVVGYGTTRKQDLTGAVGSIKSDVIQKTVTSSFENALAGRLAGIQVGTKEGAPGSGLSLMVRGGTSLNASNAPLYVIDGFPILGENESLGGEGYTTQSPLITLNPSDIESIELLKDASATAIYGARGANGVILITTKRGSRDKKPTVTFDAYVGVQELPRKIDVLSGAEFASLMSEVFPNDSSYYLNGEIITGPSKVWQDEIYRSAAIQNYKVGITGGSNSTDYSVSAGYFNQDGIVQGSNFERYSLNVRLNTNVTDRIQFGVNGNFGVTKNQGAISAVNGGFARSSGTTFYSLFYRPIFPVNTDGILQDEDINNVNPVTLATRTIQLNNTYRILQNFYGEYTIADGLKLKVSMGGTINAVKAKNYYPGDFGIGKNSGGAIVRLRQQQTLNWLNENTLTYDKTIAKDHHLSIVTGYTQQKNIWEFLGAEAVGFSIETPNNLDNIGAASLNKPSSSNRTEWGLKSFLGRINYGLLDKYLATFTFRADGSSRFAEGHKWGYFPSGALAWKANNETFMQNLKEVSNLKVRASYGFTGNQEIGLYQSLAALSQANYNFNNSLVLGFTPSRIANPDLKWESTEQVDLGIELGLFQDRINFELDLYQKMTRDLLLNVPVPNTSGYSVSLQNLGEVRNKGMELRINTINVAKGDFTWSTDFNISMNRNKVISLGNEAEEFYVNGSIWSITGDFIIREGESVGSIIGYKQAGVFQSEDFEDDGSGNLEVKSDIPIFTGSNPKPGDVKYEDFNGDGIVDSNDRQILGNANPINYGGITNNFTYKGIDLSIFLQWSYGNEVYNGTRYFGFSKDNFNNKFAEIKNRWTPENPSNTYWSFLGGPAEGILTDFFIEDGSYLRLSNVTLGYTVPKGVLSRLKVHNLRIYVSGDNLLLFSNYKGYDPDVSVSNNPLTPGIDFGAYPRSRTIRGGISVSL